MTWPTDDIGHEAAVVSADLLRAVRGPRFEKTAATTAVHADLLRLVGAHPNDRPQRGMKTASGLVTWHSPDDNA